MAERTRTIWEGRCPGCNEHGCVPDETDGKMKYGSWWCFKCEAMVECTKTSYTGPELTPMPPNFHHPLCSHLPSRPVRGCSFCCYQKADGSWDGAWFRHPLPDRILRYYRDDQRKQEEQQYQRK